MQISFRRFLCAVLAGRAWTRTARETGSESWGEICYLKVILLLQMISVPRAPSHLRLVWIQHFVRSSFILAYSANKAKRSYASYCKQTNKWTNNNPDQLFGALRSLFCITSLYLLYGCLPEAPTNLLIWNCRQLCLTNKHRQIDSAHPATLPAQHEMVENICKQVASEVNLIWRDKDKLKQNQT